MSMSIKRSILIIAFLLFIAACNSSTPTQEATQQIEKTIPATTGSIPTQPPTTQASATAEQISSPTRTLEPSPTSPTMGGSGVILFASNRGGAYDDLYLLDIASGQVTRLTSGDANTFPGPFSPDGSRILFTGFGLTHSFVGVMPAPLQQAQANADGSNAIDVSQSPDSDEGFPAWSPDGKRIAFTSRRDGNNEIYVMDANGENVKRLTNNPMDDFAPAWSPDGTRIAFVSDRDNEAGVNNLYVMQADGSDVRRLTSGSQIDYSPAWSPDGTKIAYRSHQDGAAEIYVIAADGSNPLNLTHDPGEDWAPAWSPDGSLIAFQTNRDGNWEIYVMKADGSEVKNLTKNPADDQMPYWKPGQTVQ